MESGTINGNSNVSIRRRYLLLAHFLLTCTIAAILSPIFISTVGFNARDVAFYESNLPVCQKLVEGSAAIVQQYQHRVDMLQASHPPRTADLAFAQKSLEWSKEIAREDQEHLNWDKRMVQSTTRFSQIFFYGGVVLGMGLLFVMFLSAQRYFSHVWREPSLMNESPIPR